MTLQIVPPVAPSKELDKAHKDLKQSCQQFEAYFTDLMLKEMRKTVPQNDMLGEQSNQRAIFQDMMDQTLADHMSQRGDMGLAQMMYNELAPSLSTKKASEAGDPISSGTGTKAVPEIRR